MRYHKCARLLAVLSVAALAVASLTVFAVTDDSSADSAVYVDNFSDLKNALKEGNRLVIVTDPMLATGGSSCDALTMLKERGCTNIRLMCLVGAPEGIARVQKEHPDVDIYLASVDDHLNENAYIVPGLGDAGDRIFGTK